MDLFDKIERAFKTGIAIISAYQAITTLIKRIKDAKRQKEIKAAETNISSVDAGNSELYAGSKEASAG